MRRDHDFDDHTDDAIHLSALGRSQPRRGHPLDGGGTNIHTEIAFERLVQPLSRQHAYLWPGAPRRRWWARLILAAIAVALIGAALGLTVAVAITGS